MPPTPHVELHSGDPDATRRIGEALGRLAEPGDVLLLQGELGAGKTTFTQGFAMGTGSVELVNSPTFVLVNEYRGRLPVYHSDLYRLDDPEEVERLDLANASLEGVLLVEWPERGEGLLPPDHLLVRIEHTGPEARRLTLVPHGPRSAALLAAFGGATAGEVEAAATDPDPAAPEHQAHPAQGTAPEAARPWN